MPKHCATPLDGHTLGPVIAELEALTGIETRRIHVDKDYHGHDHPQKFRVWISGQVRRVTTARSATRCVAGRRRAVHRAHQGRAPVGRNYLKGREGDRFNAVMAAAGYNFSLLLRWLERALIRALLAAPSRLETPYKAPQRFFTDDSLVSGIGVGGSRPRTLLLSVLRRGRLGTIHKSGVFPLPA
jgi:IS5 family transposase